MCPPVIVDDEDSEDGTEDAPARAKDADRESEGDDDDELQVPVRRGEIKSARDLFGEEICNRARNAHQGLKSHLSGKILVSVNGKESYLFDWSGDQPRCTQASGSDADCKIELSEDDLLKLCSGNLNPQIAMLSDKVNIAGRGDMAVYFFNLLAPRR